MDVAVIVEFYSLLSYSYYYLRIMEIADVADKEKVFEKNA